MSCRSSSRWKAALLSLTPSEVCTNPTAPTRVLTTCDEAGILFSSGTLSPACHRCNPWFVHWRGGGPRVRLRHPLLLTKRNVLHRRGQAWARGGRWDVAKDAKGNTYPARRLGGCDVVICNFVRVDCCRGSSLRALIVSFLYSLLSCTCGFVATNRTRINGCVGKADSGQRITLQRACIHWSEFRSSRGRSHGVRFARIGIGFW